MTIQATTRVTIRNPFAARRLARAGSAAFGGMPRALPGRTLLALVVGTTLAAVPLADAAAQKADAPGGAASEAAPPLLRSGSGPCQDLYETVRKHIDLVPEDVGSSSPEDADRLAGRVEEMNRKAEAFEAQCRDADPVQMAEVRYAHAKGLYLLSERFRYARHEELRAEEVGTGITDALRRSMRAYFGQVRALADGAFEGLPDAHPFRPRALQIAGQAADEGDDDEGAVRIYQQFADMYPTDPQFDRVILALARCHLDREEYELGIAMAERVMKDFYENESYYTAGEILWKLYHSKGDLAGMARSVETVLTVYPVRLTSASLSAAMRERVGLFIDFARFRKGYTLFATGKLPEAVLAFQDHIAECDGRPSTNPARQVNCDRSRANLAFIEELGGKRPPVDLDLTWISGSSFLLASSPGKTVALVFRGVDDVRSAAFIGPVWDFTTRDPRLAMCVVSYLRFGENVDQQALAMQEELEKVGYGGPAGFDPDVSGKAIFRSFKANVGSATFFVVDPEGRLVWFMQDPRGVDTQFAKAFLERTAGGARPPGIPLPGPDAKDPRDPKDAKASDPASPSASAPSAATSASPSDQPSSSPAADASGAPLAADPEEPGILGILIAGIVVVAAVIGLLAVIVSRRGRSAPR